MAAESSAQVCLLFDMMVRAMVDKPECVSVKSVSMPNGSVVLKVGAAPEELGKLIGLGGRTSRSFRTILSAISKTQRQRYSLDIGEDIT